VKLYWRVSRFPELEHLTPAERSRLLRRVGLWRLYLAIVVAGLVAGLIAAVVVVSLLPPAYRGTPGPWALTVAAVVLLVHAGAMMGLRRVLRRTLRGLAGRERLPACLACGYPLTGFSGDRCPECGAPIPGPSDDAAVTPPASTSRRS